MTGLAKGASRMAGQEDRRTDETVGGQASGLADWRTGGLADCRPGPPPCSLLADPFHASRKAKSPRQQPAIHVRPGLSQKCCMHTARSALVGSMAASQPPVKSPTLGRPGCIAPSPAEPARPIPSERGRRHAGSHPVRAPTADPHPEPCSRWRRPRVCLQKGDAPSTCGGTAEKAIAGLSADETLKTGRWERSSWRVDEWPV